MTADGQYADRRKGLRDEGDATREIVAAVFKAPRSWRGEIEPVAIRGARLGLTRERFRDTSEAGEPITAETLVLTEVNDRELICYTALFDPDDVTGAFQELTSRWIASGDVAYPAVIEALQHLLDTHNRHDWDAVATLYRDATYIANRQLGVQEVGFMASLLELASLVPNLRVEPTEILAYSAKGYVCLVFVKGSSAEGMPVELSFLQINLVDGDRFTHIETFDPDARDAALARFDELNRQVPQLENAATRANRPVADAFNRRDVDGYLAAFGANGRYDDRRKGLQSAGPVDVAFARSFFFEQRIASVRLDLEPIAIRGDRLALIRYTFREADEPGQPIMVEVLLLSDVDNNGLITENVFFDPDDVNGAFEELTSRWIASGEVSHPGPIQAAFQLFEAVNRHEWDTIATQLGGATYVSHRQLGIDDADVDDYLSSIRMFASLVPDLWIEAAEVLAYSVSGVVAAMVMKGTSTDDTAIEIPAIYLALFEGERVTHFETYDPEQRVAALARSDELNQQGPQLEQDAVIESMRRLYGVMNRHDWEALTAHFGDSTFVNHRQLASAGEGSIDDYMSSMRMMESLVPDLWFDFSEVLAVSATGAVTRPILRGTSTDGAHVEIPLIGITMLDSDRITRFELFDGDQRDRALARFQELNS